MALVKGFAVEKDSISILFLRGYPIEGIILMFDTITNT